MEADDINPSQGGQRLQQFIESFAAKLMWVVAKTIVTTFITGSIGMAAFYVKEIRDDVKHGAVRMGEVEHRQEADHTSQLLTAQRVETLQRVSDQTVQTLRQMGEQMSRDHDDLNQLKSERRR